MAPSRNSSSALDGNAFLVPSARELTLPVSPVDMEVLAVDVLQRFQEEARLLAIPLVDGGSYAGTLSRHGFLGFMTHAFTKELFARKTLRALLKASPELAAVPVVARAGQGIDEVMRQFLAHDPDASCEALPVVNEGEVLGVIAVADMMMSLAESQEKLIRIMQELSERLRSEVASAALLQQTLLPSPEIQLPGVRGMADLITSSEVGGDFYDYYVVERRWVVLLVGDVSGHGVAAGTMVGAAKAGSNLLSDEGEKNPSIILGRLNQTLLRTARASLLMTMFCVCLDIRTGELRFANAGHPFPYIYRGAAGIWEPLEVGGMPLGRSDESEYETFSSEMDVGDRLFLYTDGVVEEENDAGEAFGWDRLESLLVDHGENEITELRDNILAELLAFHGCNTFTDDVTVVCVEHFERQQASIRAVSEDDSRSLEVVRLAETFYRANADSLSSRLSRQSLILMADGEFSDLLPRLSSDGIRRVLPLSHPAISRLGISRLLRQHLFGLGDDLGRIVPAGGVGRRFDITHSDEKAFLLDEAGAWLMDREIAEEDRLAAIVLVLDEMVENGLYAAPRDGRNAPLFAKGTPRAVDSGEHLQLALAVADGLLALSVTDTWGSLTPAIFLDRLTRNVLGEGLEAGKGGGGLYLIWRMADYLQIRVHPNRQTQITAVFDLQNPFYPEGDKGFQFLYHSEVHETVGHDKRIPDHQAAAGF